MHRDGEELEGVYWVYGDKLVNTRRFGTGYAGSQMKLMYGTCLAPRGLRKADKHFEPSTYHRIAIAMI